MSSVMSKEERASKRNMLREEQEKLREDKIFNERERKSKFDAETEEVEYDMRRAGKSSEEILIEIDKRRARIIREEAEDFLEFDKELERLGKDIQAMSAEVSTQCETGASDTVGDARNNNGNNLRNPAAAYDYNVRRNWGDGNNRNNNPERNNKIKMLPTEKFKIDIEELADWLLMYETDALACN